MRIQLFCDKAAKSRRFHWFYFSDPSSASGTILSNPSNPASTSFTPPCALVVIRVHRVDGNIVIDRNFQGI